MRIRLLENSTQDYDWGSATAIPELLGEEPGGGPVAELWMGAHPKAPSRVLLDGEALPLPAWIERHPREVLGDGVVARFGPALPFLLKVLAADRPLSIQAHPSAEQARAGFEREEGASPAIDPKYRCYADPGPKPELLCALTPFRALLGFRRPDEIVKLVGELELPELEGAVGALAASPGAAGLRRFFAELMELTDEAREHAVASAARAGRAGDARAPLRHVAELAALHPGDVGALAPLFMNEVSLEPGEAIFLAAGVLHSYLGGVGVELMASSDNVLRGGLTDKYVDRDELARVLDFAPRRPRVLTPRECAPGEHVYAAPAEEFELALLHVRRDRPLASAAPRGVELLLCVEGEAEAVTGDGPSLPLGRGTSAIAPAAAGAYRLEGDARVFRARVPRA